MARRGPPRKPDILRLRDGQEVNGRDPRATGRLGKPPEEIRGDPVARSLWTRILKHMPDGLYTTVDRETLIQACAVWSDWRSALKAGDSYTMCRVGKVWLSYSVRLGLSPGDRTRLELPDVQEAQKAFENYKQKRAAANG